MGGDIMEVRSLRLSSYYRLGECIYAIVTASDVAKNGDCTGQGQKNSVKINYQHGKGEKKYDTRRKEVMADIACAYSRLCCKNRTVEHWRGILESLPKFEDPRTFGRGIETSDDGAIYQVE